MGRVGAAAAADQARAEIEPRLGRFGVAFAGHCLVRRPANVVIDVADVSRERVKELEAEK